ncbi:MAG: matrixin family metalloprotease [Ectothiorhodospiraceae bacterium AqS1]|nr:matrixin family metalloprotease [Ectothiorhodospiraceae bacterium AqS1]
MGDCTARGALTELSGIRLLAMALFSGALVLLIFLPMETTRAWTQEKHENGTPLKRNGREVDMEVRFGEGTSDICSPKAEGVELYEFGPCWNDVIKSAADQWYRTDARVRINLKSSSVEPGCTIGDGINTVTLGDNYCGREFGEQTLGVAFYRYSPRGIILESNVVFNTAFSWNSYSGPLRRVSAEVPLIDMHRVAIHEFGHVWGLDHPDEAEQEVVAIMNSKYSSIDRLQQDDIDGIVGIYGKADPLGPPVGLSGNIELDDTGALAIDEGGSGTFTVKLDTRPYADVTVDVRSADSRVVTVNPASLIFNASNHSSPQELTVTARHDIDIANESVDITLSAIGGIVASDVKKSVTVSDDDSPGSLVMLPSPLQVVKGRQENLLVRLGAAPTVSGVVVSLAGTNPAVRLNPASLTFTDGNWSDDQTVTVSVAENDGAENRLDTITGSYLNAAGNYASAAGARGATIDVIILDHPGDIVTSVQMVDLVEGGEAVEFTVRLSEAPVNTDSVTVDLSNSNRDITLTPPVLLFTRDNWNAERIVRLKASEDDDNEEDYDFIVLSGDGGNYNSTTTVSVSVEENDNRRGFIGGTLSRTGVYALAIPPQSGSDSSDIRIRCKQSKRCAVYFDCSAQEDGAPFRGWLPELIPAWGTLTVGASDIARYTGGLSWSGKGRLGCLLRSKERIEAQVWTRSGDGVLVNNSALLKSALDSESDKQRADIESIPSPDGNEMTNLRIRCLAPEGEHCTRTTLSCYTDDGTLHEGELGRITRLTVRHIQTSELSSLIDYHWQSMGLSCELRSDNHFTVQVMTRTGGGGALVNNSAAR